MYPPFLRKKLLHPQDVLDDSNPVGRILILVAHEGIFLVSWTHEEVLDDFDPLGERFSTCD